MLFGFVVIDNWDMELKEMNKDKTGEPFRYPNTRLLLLRYAKVYFHIQYRQTNEGIARTCPQESTFYTPTYSLISRRINSGL